MNIFFGVKSESLEAEFEDLWSSRDSALYVFRT